MPPRYARLSALLLFLLTLIAWPFVFTRYDDAAAAAFFSLGLLGPDGLFVFIVCIAAIALIAPIAGPLHRFFLRLGRPSQSRPVLCSLLAAIISTVYLALTAITERRHLVPAMHDEFSYLIQAHQLARGHLWMPAHPLAPFFDSFQLLVQPVYASAYFPGTAMLYVPGIWLHLPPYVTSLLISGAIAGLLFWITTELLGGLAGWLATLLLLSDIAFRQLSVMTLAQLPLLLYALLATAAWLRWRKSGSKTSAISIGVFLGLAAITRPIDALCFALPIAAAVILSKNSAVTRASGPCDVRGDEKASSSPASPAWAGGPCHDEPPVVPFRQRSASVLAIILGAIPFLCLQLVIDRGITDHWLQTPFGLYADRDYPGTAYGFHTFNPDAKPASDLPQKQMLYQTYLKLIEHHQFANVLRDFYKWRLRLTVAQQSPVPYPLLVMLCPIALLGLTKSRAVVMASLPLFLLFYAAYVFFMPHYVMVAAPAVILFILIGADAITKMSGNRRFVSLALTLFIAGEATAALPQLTVADHDVFGTGILESVNTQLTALPHRPAVVLFTFDPDRNLDEEPVYNADVAWPDDADVIRAHDLGEKNRKIFNYYSRHQPDRFFYRFDEKNKSLQPLGTTRQLAGGQSTGP